MIRKDVFFGTCFEIIIKTQLRYHYI
jgi:hypothetical protein